MNKSILMTAVLMLFNVLNSTASAQKIGHFNFQALIQSMPEYEKASNEYELYKQSLEDELKSIEAEAALIQKKYEAETKKPAPVQSKLQLWAKNLESMQVYYQEKQQSIQDSLNVKMSDLLAPIKTKIEKAVEEVAKEKGYSHVIDNSYGMLIYAAEENNIESALKAKLGIKDKPAANPAAGKPAVTPAPGK
jgi:outer membrane protein